MKTVLPSIVMERHQTYLVYIVVGALYLTQPENQATATHENSVAIYLYGETSNLSSIYSGGGIIPNTA